MRGWAASPIGARPGLSSLRFANIVIGSLMTERLTKVAFVSPHCLVDFSNGAAIATREGLKLLARQGFQCMAFCGTRRQYQ